MAIFKELLEIGTNHVENGLNNFDAWSERMLTDLGPSVRPFLKEIMQWSVVLAHKKNDSSPAKRNCWDFRQCGREANGNRAAEFGICSAYLETKLDGIHGGRNGGRACWVVSGTKCGNRIKRTVFPRFLICRFCNFKKTVMNEENNNFIVSDEFMKMLIH